MAFIFTIGVALFYSVTILLSTCSVVQSVVIPSGKLSISVESMLSVLTLNVIQQKPFIWSVTNVTS